MTEQDAQGLMCELRGTQASLWEAVCELEIEGEQDMWTGLLAFHYDFGQCAVCHYWGDLVRDKAGDTLALCQDCNDLLEADIQVTEGVA